MNFHLSQLITAGTSGIRVLCEQGQDCGTLRERLEVTTCELSEEELKAIGEIINGGMRARDFALEEEVEDDDVTVPRSDGFTVGIERAGAYQAPLHTLCRVSNARLYTTHIRC